MEDFYRNICHIKCGDKLGSGFLVNEDLLITASHTLLLLYDQPDTPVFVFFEGESIVSTERIACPVSEMWRDYPIAVLRLATRTSYPAKSVSRDEPHVNAEVHTYGFLNKENNTPQHCTFRIDRVLEAGKTEEENCNAVLIPSGGERIQNFQGFSGAPLIEEGKLVGAILRQETEGQIAIRVKAICGSEFCGALSAQCGEIAISSGERRNEDILANHTPVAIGADVFMAELDSLKDKDFDPILKKRIKGDLVGSRQDLVRFFAELAKSNCTAGKKAAFYDTAAIWALQDLSWDKAEEYHMLAKECDSAYDDRAYLGYAALTSGNSDEAKQILMPINKPAVLNAYLTCMFQEGKSFSEACSIVEVTINEKNRQTHTLLAMFALREGNLIVAKQCIDDVEKLAPESIELSICRAILYFWEAMSAYYSCDNHFGFVFGDTSTFTLTSGQQECLEQAYELLLQAYEQCTDKTGNSAMHALSGLVVISTLLPDKDIAKWLQEVWKVSPMYPFGVIVALHQGILIPKEVSDKLLMEEDYWKQHPYYGRARIELLHAQGRTDEMWASFEQYKQELLDEGVSPEEYQIELLIECKEYDKARRLLKTLRTTNAKIERYRIALMIRENRIPKNQLVKSVLELAKKTEETIDYYNANLVCARAKRWKEQERNAKEWRRHGGGIFALECIAGAMLKQSKYLKAEGIIEQAKALGDCSEIIRQHELNCLVGQSRFDEAICLSATFENARSNPRLVMFQANIYRGQGQKELAKKTLRRFADEGLFDFEVYQQLVSELQPDDPDAAYEYACRLYEHDPNNTQYTNFAGMVGIMTGHSERKELLSHIFTAGAKEQNRFRTISVADAAKMIREYDERVRKINKEYQSIAFPIHLAVEASGGSVGGEIYSQWISDNPILARYGGRPISEDVQVGDEIILDYTMCLFIVELGLFDHLEKLFSKIWLPQSIFFVWGNDIKKLKETQANVVEHDKRLDEKLQSLHYEVYDTRHLAENDCTKFNYIDYVMLECAKENNTLIVQDDPFGKVLGEPIPPDWYHYQIYPCELYTSLEERMLAVPTGSASSVRGAAVQRLANQQSIVLSNVMLHELEEKKLLDTVFDYYQVYLPDCITFQIRNAAEKQRIREDAARWLEKAYNQMAMLLEQKRVQLAPDHTAGKTKKDGHPFVQLLNEEILSLEKMNCHWGIDDRCASGMGMHIGTKSQILSTLDVIHCLFRHSLISEADYFSLLDNLLRRNYSYFVPPAEFLFNRLALAGLDENGELVENSGMKRIRHSIGWALHESCGVALSPSQTIHRLEAADYYSALIRTHNTCMNMIWDSDKDEDWKRAASTWLLLFVKEYPCDTLRKLKNKSHMIAIKQMSIILELISKHKYWKEYLEWAFGYLFCTWEANPKQEGKTAEEFIRAINEIGRDVASDEVEGNQWLSIKKDYLRVFLSLLPSRFQNEVYKLPSGKKLMDKFEVPLLQSASENYSAFDCNATTPDYGAILNGDPEAMEEAFLWVSEKPFARGQDLLKHLSEKNLSSFQMHSRHALSRFFAYLAWYLPDDLQCVAQEKKRIYSRLEEM